MLDYWSELTLQKAYEARVITKKEARNSLVNDYGLSEHDARKLVKFW